jgi:threonine dehydrogenase-like Zn-dependent dehydrogenase
MTLTLANLHPVPDGLPDEAAVFTEPLAAALQVLSLAHVRPDDQTGVVGDGKLGLLVAQVLATTGAEVTVIGRHPDKLALAAGWGLQTGRPDRKLDLVVDCTGHPGGLATALELVRPRGVVVLKSTYHGPTEANLTQVVVDEVRLVGSRCGPFRPALQLLQSGRVDVASLIEARYPLVDGLAALEHAGRRGALKVLIQL